MARIRKTVIDLNRYRRQWAALTKAPAFGQEQTPSPRSRLKQVKTFGSNPGALKMLVHVPKQLAPSPGLVVVLHGCNQTASGYDHGTGWSRLADRHGFVVLFPEQKQANNPKNCFTWFQSEDTSRDSGEALSIRQMVDRAVADHGIDTSRIFVTGLSAGGAMTSVMLATYPEVFAAGAVIAGLPYGIASNVQEAFQGMFQGRTHAPREWGDLVRRASPHRGPWPKLSIWHGTADATVVHGNAGETLKQWTDVHGLPEQAFEEDVVDGCRHRVWRNAAGEAVIEDYTITGMAHGTPLDTRAEALGRGVAGPFLLEAGISSTWHIARFWGLTDVVVSEAAAPAEEEAAEVQEAAPAAAMAGFRGRPGRGLTSEVQDVIAKALKSAGLMR
jgi:feruloyl esterase